MMEKNEKQNSPVRNDALQKLKLLITVVERRKADFYLDYLQQFEMNFQMSLLAEGTARTETLRMLGLDKTEKSVLIGVVREDRIRDILAGLEEKFETVRDGKGIAYTVPMSSVIGVMIYRFLSNDRG